MTNLSIDPQIARQARSRAVGAGTSLSAVVQDWLEQFYIPGEAHAGADGAEYAALERQAERLSAECDRRAAQIASLAAQARIWKDAAAGGTPEAMISATEAARAVLETLAAIPEAGGQVTPGETPQACLESEYGQEDDPEDELTGAEKRYHGIEE